MIVFKKIYNRFFSRSAGRFAAFLLFSLPLANAYAAQVTLAWDPNPEINVAGYKVYYGDASRVYAHAVDVGTQTVYLLTGLQNGGTYYFAATAYDTFGNESDYSAELSWTSPAGDTPPVNEPPYAVLSADIIDNDPLLVSFDGGSSYDNDGQVVKYTWDFGAGAGGDLAYIEHEFPAAGDYTVTLTVTDDEGATAYDNATVSVYDDSYSAGEIFVNFQPAEALAPPGYLVDSGEYFDEAAGYGWTQIDSFKVEDRRLEDSLGREYDTLLYLSPAAVWEMALESGQYVVTVCMGDPSYPIGRQNARAEGLPVIVNESLNDDLRWVTRNITVDVTDGRLTLTFEGGRRFVRLCWVKIRKAHASAAAAIDAEITAGSLSRQMTFDGSSSNGFDPLTATYLWDFGDGESGLGIYIKHVFPTSGVYPVSLTVRDEQGGLAMAVKKIMVVSGQ